MLTQNEASNMIVLLNPKSGVSGVTLQSVCIPSIEVGRVHVLSFSFELPGIVWLPNQKMSR